MAVSEEEDMTMEFTDDKIRIYEEYLSTGKLNGKKITNQFAIARELGTSVGRINKWHQEQALRAQADSVKAKEDRDKALADLEILQAKTQNELIGTIVRVALIIILSVGTVTTALYVFFTVMGYDIKLIQATWGQTMVVLLTNSFSIVGTLMGVKTANKEKT